MEALSRARACSCSAVWPARVPNHVHMSVTAPLYFVPSRRPHQIPPHALTINLTERVQSKQRRRANQRLAVPRERNHVDQETVAFARGGGEAESASEHLEEEVLRSGRAREEDAVDLGEIGCQKGAGGSYFEWVNSRRKARGMERKGEGKEGTVPPSVRMPKLTNTGNSPALNARYVSTRSPCFVPSYTNRASIPRARNVLVNVTTCATDAPNTRVERRSVWVGGWEFQGRRRRGYISERATKRGFSIVVGGGGGGNRGKVTKPRAPKNSPCAFSNQASTAAAANASVSTWRAKLERL